VARTSYHKDIEQTIEQAEFVEEQDVLPIVTGEKKAKRILKKK
jgi:hypothetical protein